MRAGRGAGKGPVAALREAPWGLWARQVGGIVGLELRKALSGRRVVLPALLAFAPVLLFAGLLLLPRGPEEAEGSAHASFLYAAFFQAFMLRMVIFFGCVAIFTSLFRGEMQDRTLHYYFLCPVRRGVLVAGKYLSGLVQSVLLFAGSTAVSYVLLLAPRGRPLGLEGPRETELPHLVSYVGVAILACVGYGAVFLALGLFFRNAVVSSVGILGWESLNFLLPPLLKKISIVHYLQSLCPVPVSEGPFALIAQPTPPRFAIPCLFVVSFALLVAASLRLRRTEILYGGGD